MAAAWAPDLAPGASSEDSVPLGQRTLAERGRSSQQLLILPALLPRRRAAGLAILTLGRLGSGSLLVAAVPEDVHPSGAALVAAAALLCRRRPPPAAAPRQMPAAAAALCLLCGQGSCLLPQV